MPSKYLRGKTWWIQYYSGGKCVRKSLKTRDKTVATYKFNQLTNQIIRGDSPLPNKNIKANDALEEYLAYCRTRVTPTTLSHYKIYVKGLLDYKKIYFLREITEPAVIDYIDSRPSSKSTKHHIIRYITAFINWAIKQNYLSENPIKNIHRPKLEQTKHRFLSREEIKKIIENSHDVGLTEYMTFAVYTGMRPSELKRLRWVDINWESDTIIVQKSKTGKARAIPIHPEIKMLNLKQNGEKVFDWTNMRMRFKKLKELTGIMDIDLYTFRHTFASQLIMAGADLVTVKNLMGHSRIETTMVYSHLSDQHAQNAITKLKF